MNTEKNTKHKEEQTLVIIKPDGVQRSLIGEIIKRYERSGLKLTALKMLVPTKEMVNDHYSTDPEWKIKVGQKNIDAYIAEGKVPPETDPLEAGRKVIERLVKYITAGPVVAMVWQGANSIAIVRKITGGTEPLTSAVGTIRGDFVLDSYPMSDVEGRAVRNLVHSSGAVEEAKTEIKLWFKDEEILDYTHVLEDITHATDLHGVINRPKN